MSSLNANEKSGGGFLLEAVAVVPVDERLLFATGVGATPEMALFAIDDKPLPRLSDVMICRGGVVDVPVGTAAAAAAANPDADAPALARGCKGIV